MLSIRISLQMMISRLTTSMPVHTMGQSNLSTQLTLPGMMPCRRKEKWRLIMRAAMCGRWTSTTLRPDKLQPSVGNGESCSLLAQPVHVQAFAAANVSEPELFEEFDSKLVSTSANSEDMCDTESVFAEEDEPGVGSPTNLAMPAELLKEAD